MNGPTSLLIVGVAVPIIGFLAAAAARLAISAYRAPRLSWAASTLCGIVGAALGAGATALALGRSARDAPVAVVAGGLAGTAVVLVGADLLARGHRDPVRSPHELIRSGEGSDVEFKSSARFNRHTAARDPRLELVVATTIAGFANARGGTLLIGVADDGTIAGIEDDYRLVKEASRDKYELWLRDLLTTTLGGPAASEVAVEFDRIDDRDICVVRVPAASRPVFVRPPKQRMSQFVVRVGNSTREFDPAELLSYANGRWSRRVLGRPVRRARIPQRAAAADESAAPPLPETAA